MTQTISEPLLRQLSELCADRLGLNFPPARWSDLERGILSAASDLSLEDPEPFIQRLLCSPMSRSQVEALASHLTVGETYFYRDKGAFEALEAHILPQLISTHTKSEKRLRIWSAGCSTGEEVYSIAIAVSRAIPDLKDWNVTILATDINPRFLKKAARGLYGAWSFRDGPPWVSERYFKRTEDGYYQLLPAIKEMVSFAYLNLAEDVYPSLLNNTNAMDLIFCRNVLMYFVPDRARKVIQNLYHALAEGGWIFVSPSETSHTLFQQFVTATVNGTILYRKDSGKSQTVKDYLEQKVLLYSLDDGTQATAGPLQEDSSFPAPGAGITSASEPVWEAKTEPAQQALPTPPEPGESDSLVDVKHPAQEAQRLYENGRYEEAAGMLRELIVDDKAGGLKSAQSMVLLARVYANQGKLKEALEWCEKALAEDKLNAGLHYLRSTILQEQGVIDEAIHSLKRALYLDQNFVLAHFSLGNLARKKGKPKEAARHFENSLSILGVYPPEEIVPESEGITAGRLREIVESTVEGVVSS